MYYTKAELEKMKTEEPKKYLYYHQEDEFDMMGVRLKGDWQIGVYFPGQEGSKKPPYEMLYDAVKKGTGVYVVDTDTKKNPLGVRRLRFTTEKGEDGQERIKVETVAEPQKPRNFSYYLKRIFSLGIWGGELSRQHKEYDEYIEHAEEIKERFQTEKKAYFDRRSEQDAEKNRELDRENPHKRERGLDTIEEFFGPMRSNEDAKKREEKIAEHIAKNGILTRAEFMERRRLEIPENSALGQICQEAGWKGRDIAMIGFAAFSTPEVLDKVCPESATNDQDRLKLHTNGWYIKTEGAFSRAPRANVGRQMDISVVHEATEEALKEYLVHGNPSLIAHYLKEGIQRCTGHVLSCEVSENPLSTSFSDFCAFTTELLRVMDKDPKLQKAVRDAGLTDTMERDARMVSNFDKVWKAGLEGRDTLLYGEKLTEQEKLKAATDVANWGMLVQHMGDTNKEFLQGEFARKISADAEKRVDDAREEWNLAEQEMKEKKNNPDALKRYENAMNNLNQALNELNYSSVVDGGGNRWGELHYDVKTSKEQLKLFGGEGKLQELQTQMQDLLAKSDLMKLDPAALVEQLSSKNLNKNLPKLLGKEQPAPEKVSEARLSAPEKVSEARLSAPGKAPKERKTEKSAPGMAK